MTQMKIELSSSSSDARLAVYAQGTGLRTGWHCFKVDGHGYTTAEGTRLHDVPCRPQSHWEILLRILMAFGAWAIYNEHYKWWHQLSKFLHLPQLHMWPSKLNGYIIHPYILVVTANDCSIYPGVRAV